MNMFIELPLVVRYEQLVRELEAEGMTRSDAQAAADAELLNKEST